MRQFAAIILLILFTASCVSKGIYKKPSGSALPEPERFDHKQKAGQGLDSRSNASYNLTLEGYNLLQKKDYNGAIRILERAVGVNPSDGPGYYYLAEAWMVKGSKRLAVQFNRLASIYLRNSRKWADRAEDQRKRIKDMDTDD